MNLKYTGFILILLASFNFKAQASTPPTPVALELDTGSKIVKMLQKINETLPLDLAQQNLNQIRQQNTAQIKESSTKGAAATL